MLATTQSMNELPRPGGQVRPPWGVWLIAASLLLGLGQATIALVSTDGVPLDSRAIAFGVHLGISALLAWGLWRRHPLVHRLYLVFSSLSLVFGVLALVLAVTRGQSVIALLDTWIELAVAGLFIFGLSRPSTRAWFGLQCPQCGSQRIKPKSLGMRRLACKACDYGWDRHTSHAIDPKTFD